MVRVWRLRNMLLSVGMAALIAAFTIIPAMATAGQELTGGGPGRATMTLVLTIYNSAFKDYKMGYASAVSMVLLGMVLFISFLQKIAFREKTKRKGGHAV